LGTRNPHVVGDGGRSTLGTARPFQIYTSRVPLVGRSLARLNSVNSARVGRARVAVTVTPGLAPRYPVRITITQYRMDDITSSPRRSGLLPLTTNQEIRSGEDTFQIQTRSRTRTNDINLHIQVFQFPFSMLPLSDTLSHCSEPYMCATQHCTEAHRRPKTSLSHPLTPHTLDASSQMYKTNIQDPVEPLPAKMCQSEDIKQNDTAKEKCAYTADQKRREKELPNGIISTHQFACLLAPRARLLACLRTCLDDHIATEPAKGKCTLAGM
jgi:hypothetical protein